MQRMCIEAETRWVSARLWRQQYQQQRDSRLIVDVGASGLVRYSMTRPAETAVDERQIRGGSFEREAIVP